tara:strand:- start:731 stop:1429 length:699 start_codon:yes stop_codon:yes gene_type:complete
MKILCTICARSGSKGIKNKNIKQLLGKPLIYYTIKQAKNAKIFSNIVVSTDSAKIKKIANKYKVSCWYLRSKKLSNDYSSKLPVIKDALIKSEKKFGIKYDYICDLDVTSPLRKIKDIILSYKKVKKKNIQNLISVCFSKKNPFFNVIIKKNKGFEIVNYSSRKYKRRQDAPVCYDVNAAIYFWKRQALIANKKLIGSQTNIHIMPQNRSIDIDTKDDFEYVEYLLKKNGKN